MSALFSVWILLVWGLKNHVNDLGSGLGGSVLEGCLSQKFKSGRSEPGKNTVFALATLHAYCLHCQRQAAQAVLYLGAVLFEPTFS